MKLEEKKLPNGWEVRKLGEVCGIVYGKGLPVKELKSSGYPVFGANGIIGFNNKFLFEEPQVLISCRGAASGKINLSPPKCYVTNNSLVLDIKKKDELDRNYLFFALNIANKTKLVTGTAQPQVTINNAVELEIPIPPLSEQQQIVAKIEELFSELENGKKELLIAQVKLKTYRQSLLKWAFEGRLTNKNLKDGELPEGWEVKKLGEVCKKISLNGIKIKQKDYLQEGRFPVVDQGQELIGGYFNNEKLVIPNDPPYIIFGDHTKVKKFINFKFIAGADGVKVLKVNSILDPKFFFYLIHTVKIPDKGYARHFQFLEREEIPLPPLPEQQQIVAILESKLTICDAIEETIKTSINKGETLRQSILKKAFLGTLINKKNL